MPVTDTHPQYDEYIERWITARDVIEGEEALKRKGRAGVYLPKLPGHAGRPASYATYLRNAHFFNATARTHAGLKGLVERKDPDIEAPGVLDEFLLDATGDGRSFVEFAFSLVDESLSTGRPGVLVDFAEPKGTAQSKSDEKAEGLRPFVVLYMAESICNWWTARIDGKEKLVKVVLRESVRVEDPVDEFSSKSQTRYRVLDLEPTDDGGYGPYRQRTYEIVDSQGGSSGEDEYAENLSLRVHPVMNMKYLDFIPFEFVGLIDVTRPPLMDLVAANLAHYRNSASLENGLVLAGSPTPWVNNYERSKEESKEDGSLETKGEMWMMGGGNVWTFKGPCEVGKISISEGDLSAISSAMTQKEQYMVILGARVIESEQAPAESGIAKKIDDDRDASMLASLSKLVSKSLTRILTICRDWSGDTASDVSVSMNTDFFGRALTPAEATAVADLWQKYRLYTRDDARRILRRGEWIPSDRTDEAIEDELEAEDMIGLEEPDPPSILPTSTEPEE